MSLPFIDDPPHSIGMTIEIADDLLSWDYPAFADEAGLEFPGFDVFEDCLFVATQGRGCLGDGEEVLVGHDIPKCLISSISLKIFLKSKFSGREE